LPPPNSRATSITEADRAEIVARANDVIDYYLNGPGSYFDAGPRKPLMTEPGDSTLTDLKNFKASVETSMQFAADPSEIMQSVVHLLARRIASPSPAIPFRPTVQPASGDRDLLNGASFGGGGPSRNPNLPAPPSEAGRPLGIVSGQPMPDWITPPPIFG